MRVYHFTSTTGDFAPSPIRGWVMCEDAEAEIEKARREGRDEVLQSRLSEHWPNVQKRLEESARADERERIFIYIRDLISSCKFRDEEQRSRAEALDFLE